MSILPLRYYGDPILREKGRAVEAVDDELRRLAEDMTETMYAAKGVGLAAQQIGDLRLILVLDVSEPDRTKRRNGEQAERSPEVYLNPEILESSVEDAPYTEGCLSIPEIEAEIYRPIRIRLRWMDLNGETHDQEFDGFRARVLQHEIDHLNGVLFIDHLGMMKRQLLAGKLNALKKRLEEERGGQAEG